MTTSHPVAELTFGTPDALENLGVPAHRAYALDENTLLRIRARKTTTGTATGIGSSSAPATAPVMSQVQVKIPIGPLATCTIALHALPNDIIVTAAEIEDIAVRAFTQAKLSNDAEDKDASFITLPYHVHVQSTPSWPGFLPVSKGWQVVDYVLVTAFRTPEKQGRVVAIESSDPMGMPPSLSDQKVLTVSDGTGETVVGTGKGQSQEISKSVVDMTMRDVFTLCAVGFIPEQPDEKEPVRVFAEGRWHRLGGRFGSIFTLESFGMLPLANQRGRSLIPTTRRSG